MRRIEKLIGDGRYMTRAELDSIPRYERLSLVRELNGFYSDLPEDYNRPFPGRNGFFAKEYRDESGNILLDFHYPQEAEWQAVRELLDDGERVDALLSQMSYIFENTSPEDRYYNSRKAALEHLTAFKNGAYTLFPGLERLPEPGAAAPRIAAPTSETQNSGREMIEDMRESRLGGYDWDIPQTAPVQMSLFDLANPLPSVDEQRSKIDQTLKQEAAEVKAASLLAISTNALYRQ
jgi:hypothetical protein